MHVKDLFTTSLRKLLGLSSISNDIKYRFEDQSLCTGQLLQSLHKNIVKIETLKDVEFKVFSQWGDDGIIAWIVNQLKLEDPFFVEFGVQTYEESNTRFLLQNQNWSGLIIDGNKDFIDYIKKDRIYWKHDLRAENLFITKENIDKFLETKCPKKDIDLLSIDIDGNDYWIFEAINSVSAKILICEYNSLLGEVDELTIPYNPNFFRTDAHYSNLYFGASIQALISLSQKKGYTFLGTNSNANNAYFIRNDLCSIFEDKIKLKKIFSAKFRESRNYTGALTHLGKPDAIKEIKHLPLFNIKVSKMMTVEDLLK